MVKEKKKLNTFKVTVKKQKSVDMEDFNEFIIDEAEDEFFKNAFQSGYSEMD